VFYKKPTKQLVFFVVVFLILVLILYITIIKENKGFEEKILSLQEAIDIEVYFENLENRVLEIIGESKDINCAVYSIKSDKIRTKLRDKNALVLTNKDYEESQEGKKQKRGLMHNKFCVLEKKDGSLEVITGSFNFQPKDEKNNILLIKDRELAEIYQSYFNHIYKKVFLNISESFFRGPYLTQNFVVCFPKSKTCFEILQKMFEKSEKTRCAMFAFTTDPGLKNRDSVVVDKSMAHLFPPGDFSGIFVYPKNEKMHHKFCLFELGQEEREENKHNKYFILTGSANISKNAFFFNMENMVLFRSQAMFNRFLEEFENLKAS